MKHVRFWYVVNASLLLCHQVDAATQQEWHLFGAPAGRDGAVGFVLFHVPVLILAFVGLLKVADGSRTGLVFSAALALTGLATCVIHAWFFIQGHPEFSDAVSIGILAGILIASIGQAIAVCLSWGTRTPDATAAGKLPVDARR